MFSIFNKGKSKEVNFSQLSTDMHSHLLPGIDDGSPDVNMSDLLIKGLQDLGYKKMITTPHIMADVFPNTPATIDAAFDTLKKETAIPSVSFGISPAAEYLLDDGFDEIVKSPEPLLCISGH